MEYFLNYTLDDRLSLQTSYSNHGENDSFHKGGRLCGKGLTSIQVERICFVGGHKVMKKKLRKPNFSWSFSIQTLRKTYQVDSEWHEMANCESHALTYNMIRRNFASTQGRSSGELAWELLPT